MSLPFRPNLISGLPDLPPTPTILTARDRCQNFSHVHAAIVANILRVTNQRRLPGSIFTQYCFRGYEMIHTNEEMTNI